MSATQYPVATICGSMRYYDKMLEHAARLTSQGWIVLMPFVTKYVGGQIADEQKKMLDDMHFTKISMSDGIFVIGTHIGESTSNEMAYAEEHGVAIYRVNTP
jgi:hypothetical protein